MRPSPATDSRTSLNFRCRSRYGKGISIPCSWNLPLDHHPLFVLQAIGTGPFAAAELRLSRLTSVGSPAFALVPLHCPLLDYVVACNCVRDAVWDAVDRCVNARCAKFLKW